MNSDKITIEMDTFDGEKVVRIVNGKTEMLITVNIGPRICFFGKTGGKNILYWNKGEVEYKDWKLYGGHRVWLTRPMADETEDTYQQDNDPCEVDFIEGGVIITGFPTRGNIIRGLKVIAKVDGAYEVTGFLKNQGPMLYSAGVWAPTCIQPDGKVFGVSIGDERASWDAVKLVIPRRFGGMEVLVNDDQISFSEKFMIVHPKGRVSKRCLYSAKGIVAMNWEEENISFVKKVKSVRDGNYQMGGCNMAVFVGKDNFMVEMETYGEEKTIYPGETIEHSEEWVLQEGLVDFN